MLTEFNEEEGKKVIEKIEEVLKEFSAHLVAIPYYTPQGNTQARIHVMKKEEVKEEPVPTSEYIQPVDYIEEPSTVTTAEVKKEEPNVCPI